MAVCGRRSLEQLEKERAALRGNVQALQEGGRPGLCTGPEGWLLPLKRVARVLLLWPVGCACDWYPEILTALVLCMRCSAVSEKKQLKVQLRRAAVGGALRDVRDQTGADTPPRLLSSSTSTDDLPAPGELLLLANSARVQV